MPAVKDMDMEVRARIRAWLAHYKAKRSWTNSELAAELGVAEPTVTNIINGARSAGLDLVVRMHRKLGRSADDFLDTYPKDQKP